jgi:hypothetical protein
MAILMLRLIANILAKSHSAPDCVEGKSRSGSIDVLYTDRYRYRGEVEKEKRADIYFEVWKRRGHIFFEFIFMCITLLYGEDVLR